MAINEQDKKALGDIPQDAARRLENLVLFGTEQDVDLGRLDNIGAAFKDICKPENRRVNLYPQDTLENGMKLAIENFSVKEMLNNMEVALLAVKNIDDSNALINFAKHIGLKDTLFAGLKNAEEIREKIIENLKNNMQLRIQSMQILKVFLAMDTLELPADKAKLAGLVYKLRLVMAKQFTKKNGYLPNESILDILPRFKSKHAEYKNRKQFFPKMLEAISAPDADVDKELISFMKSLASDDTWGEVNPYVSSTLLSFPLLNAFNIHQVDGAAISDVAAKVEKQLENFLKNAEAVSEADIKKVAQLRKQFGQVGEDFMPAVYEELYQMYRQQVYDDDLSQVYNPTDPRLVKTLEGKLQPLKSVYEKIKLQYGPQKIEKADKHKKVKTVEVPGDFKKQFYLLQITKIGMLDAIMKYPVLTPMEKRSMVVLVEKFYETERASLRKLYNKGENDEEERLINDLFKDAVSADARIRSNAVANENAKADLISDSGFTEIRSKLERGFAKAMSTLETRTKTSEDVRAAFLAYRDKRPNVTFESEALSAVAEPVVSRPSSSSGVFFGRTEPKAAISSHISGAMIDDQCWEDVKSYFVDLSKEKHSEIALKTSASSIHIAVGNTTDTRLEKNSYNELEASSNKHAAQLDPIDYEDMALRFRQAATVTKHTSCVLQNISDPKILSTLVGSLLREDGDYAGLPKILPNLTNAQTQLLEQEASDDQQVQNALYAYNKEKTAADQSAHGKKLDHKGG